MKASFFVPCVGHRRWSAGRVRPGLGLLVACWLGAAAQAGTGPLAITQGTEVVQHWQPQQHLYVKGNVGVAPAQLEALEQWLDTHATNWVVVLLESAAGEHFTDAEGANFTGIEAVNHALGKGLMNQTAFGQSTEAATAERNAAMFVLFLKDRRFSYFGSDAYDRRGLGEDRWIGNLDQPAIAAMRNGGRVADAVKDTITTLDTRLAGAIRQEGEQRQLRKAEAQANHARAVATAKAGLQAATEARARLGQAQAQFNSRYPNLTGALGRPDFPEMDAALQNARQALADGDLERVSSLAAGLGARVDARQQLLNQYPADAQRFERAAARHQQLAQQSYSGAAKTQLADAAASLEQALRDYLHGDPAYAGQLAATEKGLDTAEAVMAAAARATRTRWLASGAAAAFGALGLATFGVWLSRRRLPIKLKAQELAETWQRGLREKNTALFELLERRATVVGASAEEAAQRYSGATLELARKVIQNVDELFIMSACAGRMLQDAQTLLQPSGFWARQVNRFSPSRHFRALRLLRDEPIAFEPTGALQLVMRGSRSDRTRLVGKASDYAPFSLSFNELIQAFNDRATRALENLEQVENGIRALGDWATSVTAALDRVRGAREELVLAAAADGLLPLGSVFEQLFPEAEESAAKARKLGVTDPVGTLRDSGATARRQAEESAALVEAARAARREDFPRLQTAAARLEEQQVGAQWIINASRALSEAAEQLGSRGMWESVGEAIKSHRGDWAALGNRAVEAVELDERRRGPAATAIAEAVSAVVAARRELGAGLDLDPDRVLREAEADPDVLLEKAGKQLAASLAALELGDVDGAIGALTAVDNFSASAQAIVTASRQSFATHAADLVRLRSETEEISGRCPAHGEMLDGMKASYASTVLLLGAGDPRHPQANGTIEDNLGEAEQDLALARRAADEADEAFRTGALLHALRLREHIRGLQDDAQFRLQEIVEKRERLTEKVGANAETLTRLEEHHVECRRLAEAATAMPGTVALFEQAVALLDTARPLVGGAVTDPFAIASQLEAVTQALDEVEDRARCDRDVFDEAQRSVTGAAGQITEARRVAREAAADGVPDSPELLAAVARLDALAAALTELQGGLQSPHGDWPALDVEADRLTNEASTVTATVRGEVARAAAAVRLLTLAATAVRAAAGWTGRYGVAIYGAPGSDALGEARGFLQRGAYDRARTLAETARRVAAAAVAEAEAEMERRRLAELAQLERERRKREAEEAARRARRSGGGGFGGGGSSSWGRSGSGFGGSSFGGGGSGFKTSGW